MIHDPKESITSVDHSVYFPSVCYEGGFQSLMKADSQDISENIQHDLHNENVDRLPLKKTGNINISHFDSTLHLSYDVCFEDLNSSQSDMSAKKMAMEFKECGNQLETKKSTFYHKAIKDKQNINEKYPNPKNTNAPQTNNLDQKSNYIIRHTAPESRQKTEKIDGSIHIKHEETTLIVPHKTQIQKLDIPKPSYKHHSENLDSIKEFIPRHGNKSRARSTARTNLTNNDLDKETKDEDLLSTLESRYTNINRTRSKSPMTRSPVTLDKNIFVDPTRADEYLKSLNAERHLDMDFIDRNIQYQRETMLEQTEKLKKINDDIQNLMKEMDISMEDSVRISKRSVKGVIKGATFKESSFWDIFGCLGRKEDKSIKD